MIHLRSVRLEPSKLVGRGFPFDLPLIQGLGELAFTKPVTFLVGENGSGKSTLLEAMAAGMDKIAVGAEDIRRDATMAPARLLGDVMRFVWSKKTNRGFFLRAEDFFGYAKRLNAISEDLVEMDKDFESKFEGHSLTLAKSATAGQRSALKRRYGDGLDQRSHGESFLQLFQSRFVPGGLYILDEPEAPLSPLRQLSLLAMMKEMVAQDAQFIIATHSPILMAYPDATIYGLDEVPPKVVPYAEVQHVSLTRAFLNDPESYLRRL